VVRSNCLYESSVRAALIAASLIATINSISLAYSKYGAKESAVCRFLLAMDLTNCMSGTSLVTFPSLVVVVVVHVAGVVQSIVTEVKLAAGAKTVKKVGSLVQALKRRHWWEYVDLNPSMTVMQSGSFRVRFLTASLWVLSASLMPLTVRFKSWVRLSTTAAGSAAGSIFLVPGRLRRWRDSLFIIVVFVFIIVVVVVVFVFVFVFVFMVVVGWGGGKVLVS